MPCPVTDFILCSIENMPLFITAQIIGGIAVALLLFYAIKEVSRNAILVFNIAINLLWAVHYFMLKAYTGAACCLICVAMIIVFRFKRSAKFLSGIYVPLFFGAVFITFGILTWDNALSLIPIAINILITIAMWLDRALLIKTLALPIATLYIIYNFFYFSYIGAIGQSLSLVFHTVFVIKENIKLHKTKSCERRNKLAQNPTNPISNNRF